VKGCKEIRVQSAKVGKSGELTEVADRGGGRKGGGTLIE
jgi:hypothetical protein